MLQINVFMLLILAHSITNAMSRSQASADKLETNTLNFEVELALWKFGG